MFTHNNNQQAIYSISEAINIIGVKRTKLYQLINSGELKAHKIGKRTVIKHEAINKYIENIKPYSSENKIDQ